MNSLGAALVALVMAILALKGVDAQLALLEPSSWIWLLGLWFWSLVLVVTPYRIWVAQRQDISRLRAPAGITISLDEVFRGVRPRSTINPGGQGPLSNWVQFVVSSTTNAGLTANAGLIECEARLTKVEAKAEDGRFVLIENEPALCCWSQALPPDDVRTTIPPGVLQSANLFAVYQGSPDLLLQLRPTPVDLANRLQKPGTYRLHVTVTAKNVCRNQRGSYSDGAVLTTT